MAEEVQTKNFITGTGLRRFFSHIYDLFVRKKKGYGLSQNDFSDDYKYKLDNLRNYKLMPATKDRIGGLIPGDGLDIDADGKVSVIFPDHSRYATLRDVKQNNNDIDAHFAKVENSAKMRQAESEVFQKEASKRLSACEDEISSTKQQVKENIKRFDNYLLRDDYSTIVADIEGKLSKKADIKTVNDVLQKKVARNDLDGALLNLLDNIQAQQLNAADDRNNLRRLKTDVASLNNLQSLVKNNSEDIGYIMQALKSYLTEDSLKDYVKAETGKGLSERNFTAADWEKLESLYNYELPPASKTVLGGVRAGENISISEDGTLSVKIPTVEEFINKENFRKNNEDVNARIAACEDKEKEQSSSINEMNSSLNSAKTKLSELETAVGTHTAQLPSFVSKEELAGTLEAFGQTKVSTDEFQRFVSTKLTSDSFDETTKQDIDSIAAMLSDITRLKKISSTIETSSMQQGSQIRNINEAIAAIREDLPDGETYVRAEEGKQLSANDYTDEEKDKLFAALVNSDIGHKVAGLNEEGKIDSIHLPDQARGVRYVDNIEVLTTGSADVLYFNKRDKKLYYFDGVNFYPVHDGTYTDDGVDIRTAMADLYVKKSVSNANAIDIKALQERCNTLEQELAVMKDRPQLYSQAAQPEGANYGSFWYNTETKNMSFLTGTGWKTLS